MKQKSYYGVMGVIFNDKGEILLTERLEQQGHPYHKKWQLPGGGIEFGEHPLDALHREIKEEVGLKIKLITDRPILYADTRIFQDQQSQVILMTFPVIVIGGKLDTTKDPDNETGDAKWFAYEQTKHVDMLPGVAKLLKQALPFFKHP